MSSKEEEKKFFAPLFQGKDKKSAKSLYFKLGLVLILGIFFMSFGSWNSSEEGAVPEEELVAAAVPITQDSQQALEEKLSAILGGMKGAGKVEVAMTFSSHGSREYAFNQQNSEAITQEGESGQSSQRESRTVSASLDLALQHDSPVIVEEYPPQIQGVLIVAQGAGDPLIKRELFMAAQGLLGIPAHRIIIVEGK